MESIKTLACKWNVSTRTVERLIDGRKLEAVKIAGRWRITATAAERYLKSQTLKATKALPVN